MTFDDFIRQFGGLTAIIISVLGFIYTRYDANRKQEIEHESSHVNNTQKLQDMYQDALDDLEKRFEKRLLDQEKECQETISKARKSIEEHERGKRGELLVQVVDLQERNIDLKLQIERLGGFVEGATGTRIHQWKSNKGQDLAGTPSDK